MTPAIIAATLYWVLLLALTGTALVFAILAAKRPNYSWVAAGLLAVAIVLATLRFHAAPTAVAVTLSLLCIALAVAGGGPAVNLTLGLAGGSPAGEHGGILVRADGADATAKPKREVLRGGATIGILERFATVAAIVAGHPEAIAVIVALKGVGRFTELEASEARERFIIGSLMSLIWACASAALWTIAFR
jgi:hypothetical protein